MFQAKWFYEADKGGAGAGGSGDAGNGGGNEDPKPLEYDAWLSSQPDEVKTLLDGHTKGLKSALDSEREARKNLEKQARDLAGKAEKGSEAEKQLTELANTIAESDRRGDFYEAAHAAGVSNLKLAYTVAVQDEMFDKRGNVDFEALKKVYPELFGGRKAPDGNAGNGTGNNKPAGKSMNDFIRTAAGRS